MKIPKCPDCKPSDFFGWCDFVVILVILSCGILYNEHKKAVWRRSAHLVWYEFDGKQFYHWTATNAFQECVDYRNGVFVVVTNKLW